MNKDDRLINLERQIQFLENRINWLTFENKSLNFKLKKSEAAINSLKSCSRCMSHGVDLSEEPCASCNNYSNWS